MLDHHTDANRLATNALLPGRFERLAREHQNRIRSAVRHIERLIVSLVYQRGLAYCQLTTLARCHVELSDRLDKHLREEETELVPFMRTFDDAQDRGQTARHWRRRHFALEQEHHAIAAIFAQIRAATDDYQSPPGARRGYAHLLQSFALLEATLRQHWDVEEQLLLDRIAADAFSHPLELTQES